MTKAKTEPGVTKISDDPKDFLTGASSETLNATQGGTTQDGGVKVFAPSRAGGSDSASTGTS